MQCQKKKDFINITNMKTQIRIIVDVEAPITSLFDHEHYEVLTTNDPDTFVLVKSEPVSSVVAGRV